MVKLDHSEVNKGRVNAFMGSTSIQESGQIQEANRLLLPWSVLRGGGSPTYSGYRFIKIHISKIGSKFGPDKFGTNSGYLCFFNHITTVRG